MGGDTEKTCFWYLFMFLPVFEVLEAPERFQKHPLRRLERVARVRRKGARHHVWQVSVVPHL